MIPGRFPSPFGDTASYACRMQAGTSVGNLVVSFSGRIDESRLQRAIRLVMDAEPIMGCRFVPRWLLPYWQRRSDLDQLRLCEVFHAETGSPAFGCFLAQSLDASRDPLLKAAVFRGAKDTACFKFSHTVGDGPSMMKVLTRVFATYRQLLEKPDYTPECNPGASRTPKDLAAQLTRRQRWKLLRKGLLGRTPSMATWKLPAAQKANRFSGYAMLKLPPERVRALSRFGRDRRATMTSVILAGAYLAARDVFQPAGGGLLRFLTTTDLRRFLPADRQNTAPSNLSAHAHFEIEPREDDDFERVLELFRSQLKVIVRDPTLVANRLAAIGFACPLIRFPLRMIPLPALKRVFRRLGEREASQPGRQLAVVNLGEVDPDQFAWADATVEDAYATGPIYFWPVVGATFSRCRDVVTIAAGISDQVVDEAIVREYFKQIDCRLPCASAGGGDVFSIPDQSPARSA